LSKDVTIARDLEIGNCVTLNDKIICDWGDVNGTVPDLNGYMTELTFDGNFNASTYGSSDFNSVYKNTRGYYYAGVSLTLDDNNYFHVNDANLGLNFYNQTDANNVFVKVEDLNNQTVSQIVAGTNISLSPTNGVGIVTINSTASGGGIGTFRGLTSTAMDGVFTYDGNTGYVAANGMCDGNYSGTHWCTTDEIKASIDDNNYTSFPNGETAWIMEGAPGFISNSNDCVGMTANTATYYGAFWIFDTTRGGDAWLTNCSIKKPLACCG